jgi:hypothetical protein
MNQKRHLLWQCTLNVTESKSGSHWHKEHPNVCTEVTLETTSLANHHITCDCGGQQWTISGTNLIDVWSQKRKYTSVKNSKILIIKLITSTVFPVMPIVAQLIKTFPTILQKVQFITKFMIMSLKALLKHEHSKSILIQFLKIHFSVDSFLSFSNQ